MLRVVELEATDQVAGNMGRRSDGDFEQFTLFVARRVIACAGTANVDGRGYRIIAKLRLSRTIFTER